MENELTAVGVRKKSPDRAMAQGETPQRRSEERWGRKRDPPMEQALRAGPGRHSEGRSNPRLERLAGTAREGFRETGAA